MTTRTTPNTLGYAILQLLERAPLSGYDLKKQFAASLAYGWYAHDSQIYPQLKQLEAQGYVESHVEASSAGPDRRIYAITDAGLTELVAWLPTALDDTRQKSELILRVWSSDLMPPEAFKRLLADVETQTREHLERLISIRNRLQRRYGLPEVTTDPRQVGVMLCLEHDIQLARAKLTWLERALTVVETRAALSGQPLEAADMVEV
jgi:DNA-binding PadR family transcriptional regulator